MGYDMRDYIEDLKKIGEPVIEIDEEIDWNLEAAAFASMIGRVSGPVVIFNNIKGYPRGYRLLAGMFTGTWERPHRRLSAAIGLSPEISYREFFWELANRESRILKPIEVATGPCKEVIKMGKEANLYGLPWPYYSQGDGGRYSLSQAIICKDPDSDWVNWANYATMIHSRNRLSVAALVGAQLAQIFRTKYEARNQSMPVCVAIGGDPVIFIASGSGLPEGVSEADIAGALRGAPMELVRAETNELLVPADAEIVIEGEMRPYERLPEGPKAESFQFQAGPRRPTYAIRVTCITHRNDPILPVMAQNWMGDVQSFVSSIGPAIYFAYKYDLGLPIKMSGFMSHAPGTITISTSKPYDGYMRDLYDRIYCVGAMAHWDKVYVVDDDVDPTDCDQVLEAVFTQVNPARDYNITDNDSPKAMIAGAYLDDIDLERNALELSCLTTKHIVDATTKGNTRIRRTSFETVFPEHLQRWVIDNWQRWGFKEKAKWNKPYIDQKT